MLTVVRFIVLLSAFIVSINGAHILGIFSFGSKSHFSCNYAILKSLHDAGHRVTMITPFASSSKNMENFTFVDSRFRDVAVYVGQSKIWDVADLSVSYMLDIMIRQARKLCGDIMTLEAIQKALNSSERIYDVMFLEVFLDHDCFLPLAQKLAIPVVGTLAMNSWKWADAKFGIPHNPAVTPQVFGGTKIDMNFMERVENLYRSLVIDYYYTQMLKEVDQFYRNQFAAELLYKKDISFFFCNNHHSFLPRLSVPNAADIGGIHVRPASPLPKDMLTFIEEAPHGVILFSLGSVVNGSSMSVSQRYAFLAAFATIPQRVIWKFEETIESIPTNVRIYEWLPQRDILEHKNVIAFMSHCGQGGVYEAIMTGTPVVSIPIFIDQRLNADILNHRGVAVPLELKTATSETILAALDKIVNDTSYYQRMQEFSRVFQDRPMTPQQTVVYWTEYVIRHNGAPYSRSIGIDMPLYKYLMLDILALVLVLVSLVVLLIRFVVKKILRFFVNKPKHTDKSSLKKYE